MQQKKKNKGAARKKSGFSSFPIINKDAAGIDIGSEEHWVAVPADRAAEPIRRFGAFTQDLEALAEWLNQSCGDSPFHAGQIDRIFYIVSSQVKIFDTGF